ncbi:MAG: nucleotidyltransferase family protein [Candidatus Omnitrophica bacterium]|nr:nucleotidyltransferase family protein [Candidatus Omnitrophota bacterium]
MKLLILAAGYGTRLYAITKDKPKALLEIKGIPILEYIVKSVENIGDLSEIIIVTNDKFEGTFRDWAEQVRYSVPITVISDGTNSPDKRLGSIGDIAYVLKQYAFKEDLLVAGGDNLFNFNLDEYINWAHQMGPHVSIGLYDIENLEEAKKFGVVGLDPDNKIISFEEKPQNPKSTLVAMCFYYIPYQSFGLIHQYLTETEKSDTAGDYIRWLHEKNEVFGFKFSGKWYDIGSVESYYEAQEKFSF